MNRGVLTYFQPTHRLDTTPIRQGKPHQLYSLFLLLVMVAGTFGVYGQENCKGTDNRRAQQSYDRAIKALRNRNTGQAIDYLYNALEHESDFADAHWRLGRIYYNQYRVAEAEMHLKRTTAICPDYNAEVYFMLARIAYGREDYPATIPLLEEFLKDVDRIRRDSDYDNAVQMLEQARFLSRIMGNRVPFDPYKVKEISTPDDEYLTIISHDGELALFTRRVQAPQGRGAISWSERYVEIFKVAHRENGSFSRGEAMPAPFNTFGNQGGATINALNDEIFITICNNLTLPSGIVYNNCDIYHSRLVYDEWTPLEKLQGDDINRDDTWESQPSVSADGQTLYFVSDRPGGYGGSDIYAVHKNPDGTWGRPVNLGPRVNTPGHEKTPFIHTDSQTLYFSSSDLIGDNDSVSFGHKGLGGYDIFFTRMQDNGSWSRPVNLGYPINSTGDDLSFFVSTDGTTGYYSSNKIEGSGGYDLFAFDLYPEARPQKVLFIKGEVTDEYEVPVPDTKIELKNVLTDEVIEVAVDPINARYVAIAVFNSDFVLTVKKPDHIYQSRFIDKDSAAFQAPAEINFGLERVVSGKTHTLHDIYFATASADLSEKSLFMLNEFIEFLNDHPTVKVAIQGHTDNVGDAAMNLELSNQRARAVYDYLILNDIRSNRLSWKGYGMTRPVTDNTTAEGRARNRRTEFLITGR
jgi:outer membrane protein OmpA-like peptidoglycan-associated protein